MEALNLIPTPLYLAGVFSVGLLIGSFLNVVIYRLPKRLEHEWRCQCRELLELPGDEGAKRPPSIVWGRSHCTNCGHGIKAWENVPLLSWAVLRGRCSACATPISVRYPLVELLTAILFLAVSLVLPGWQGLAGLVMTAMLIALSGIDLDVQLLPDNLTMPLLWLGLTMSLFGLFTNPVDAILGALAGYLSLWTVYHLFRIVTGKEGMGHGDFKLLAALGAWLGWQHLPLIILLSSTAGAITGLGLLAFGRHKRGQALPFGPFLAAAGWVALLWGWPITNWYVTYLGL